MRPLLSTLIAAAIVASFLYWVSQSRSTSSPTKRSTTTTEATPAALKENQKMFATITTTMGDIKLELYPAEAPKAVENFKALAAKGYYNGLIFHRVIADFMIQGGDPTGTGQGGESIYGKTFADEINSHKIGEGTLAMANAGPNTNGSQFYIVTTKRDVSYLDGSYTVFGQVTDGLDVAYAISKVKTDQEKPVTDVKIVGIKVEAE